MGQGSALIVYLGNKAVCMAAPVAGGWAGAKNELGRGINELGRGSNDLGRGSKGNLHAKEKRD